MLVYGGQLVDRARTRTGQTTWAGMYARSLPAAHETGGLDSPVARSAPISPSVADLIHHATPTLHRGLARTAIELWSDES